MCLCHVNNYDFFKESQDVLYHTTFLVQHGMIRHEFFKLTWSKIYDLIEFICCLADKFKKHDGSFIRSDKILIPSEYTFHSSDRIHFKEFTEKCNEILEKEVSAWRIVDGKICKITSEAETNTVETTIHSKIKGVGQHRVCPRDIYHLMTEYMDQQDRICGIYFELPYNFI